MRIAVEWNDGMAEERGEAGVDKWKNYLNTTLLEWRRTVHTFANRPFVSPLGMRSGSLLTTDRTSPAAHRRSDRAEPPWRPLILRNELTPQMRRSLNLEEKKRKVASGTEVYPPLGPGSG